MDERLKVDYGWTRRQRDVLGLIAGGKTNAEIAGVLGISRDGVKYHVSEILSKLGSNSREEAADYWRRYNGWMPRFARVFRAAASGATLKWTATATALAGGGVVVAAVLMAGRDGVEPSLESTATTATGEPARKTYARGETVDIDSGMLFLDPRTGGGEAGAGVSSSPSGMFVAWNGADGKQPPVLFESDTYRKIILDTGGAFGTVLDYSPDDSEVSIRVGQEMLILSTETGAIRVRIPLDADAATARAHWGFGGRLAVQSSRQDRSSVGLLVWVDGSIKSFPEVPDNWAQWSPSGDAILVSGVEPEDWLALIDVNSGAMKRIDVFLRNPQWSESGQYFEGQTSSGEVFVYRADGTPHMRLGGVCAEVTSPWVGDEIGTWGFAEDVLIAMDGSLRPYTPASHSQPMTHLREDGSVALLEGFRSSTVLAELKPPPGVAITGILGEPSVTTDGRGRLAIGGGAKGECENIQPFKVEMAPFAN
jgi:DNA-binding CsgD family transcriptional regulator